MDAAGCCCGAGKCCCREPGTVLQHLVAVAPRCSRRTLPSCTLLPTRPLPPYPCVVQRRRDVHSIVHAARRHAAGWRDGALDRLKRADRAHRGEGRLLAALAFWVASAAGVAEWACSCRPRLLMGWQLDTPGMAALAGCRCRCVQQCLPHTCTPVWRLCAGQPGAGGQCERHLQQQAAPVAAHVTASRRR